MEIQKCSRCGIRPAVVFITRLENGKSVNEGLCLVCAKELGIKPVDDILKKMGISDDDIENISNEVTDLMAPGDGQEQDPDATPSEPQDDGGAPAIDFQKLFGALPSFPFRQQKNPGKGKSDSQKKQPEKKYLSMYCTNLNQKAAEGKTDRLIGRERETDRVIQILCRRQKNNPCLIGEPGVGKTAIAEALAQRIVDGKVPERLADSEIWLLDLTSLVAGTQFRGQFESRILGLIKEVKSAGNIILMIDEVHNIVGAGDSEGSMSAANMLKPALSRGEIQVIGATTLKEYRKYIEKDSALERRFQPVTVTEPSVADTIDIINGIKGYYEKFHGVRIPAESARAAAILSERYITDRFLPDKAIDLIDEAAARTALTSPELNERRRNDKLINKLAERQTELEAIVEKSEGQTETNYQTLAEIKAQSMKLEERNKELDEVLRGLTVTVNDIAKVIEVWTGIPATEIQADELTELNTLYDRISARIIGQDEAVSAVVRAIRRKRAGVSDRPSPVSMIFAGPTGVGKTELVKVLSDELFKQPESLIRLDMSEFMEKHAVSRIIGAPPGYVGYDEAGQLTEKIRRRPYAVILFDEIEKAHPDVMNILLQILDDGKITDAQGRTVNFENTVIIMTTNAGSERSSAVSGFTSSGERVTKDRTERALADFLRPEFLNRIDEIITFRHLGENDMSRIAGLMLKRLADHLAERGIALKYTPEVPDFIAHEAYSEKYGARNMRRYIERNVEDGIATVLIEKSTTAISGIGLSVADGKIKINTI